MAAWKSFTFIDTCSFMSQSPWPPRFWLHRLRVFGSQPRHYSVNQGVPEWTVTGSDRCRQSPDSRKSQHHGRRFLPGQGPQPQAHAHRQCDQEAEVGNRYHSVASAFARAPIRLLTVPNTSSPASTE
ncbi:MAG: hypothetical protein Ct9H300mP16_11220 [Pseudomonadota bacterium]|nr:MAG: hypothetical protein Ct9H300mP16_11220 [Pseudomonadota bacterium]